MTIEQLLQLDAHQAIDWLVEHKNDYELVPLKITHSMAAAAAGGNYTSEDFNYLTDDWEAMIEAHQVESSKGQVTVKQHANHGEIKIGNIYEQRNA
ncbi:hypothetical protein [Pseudoalteromonas sp. T1lg22]|uniref:hypothetical protein n=1 Tax=Pseudoalteromonas sp. T1lg22 TaxID=2077096 RepID=UPI000CF6E457|nr:hypothetical protein [Pseudoalteromonas sp. T1lg22]